MQTKQNANKNQRKAQFKLLASAGSNAQHEQRTARRKEKERGRSTYSPQSYKELLKDAVQSIEYALDDGETRMEVDFPTLSGDSKCLTSRQILNTSARNKLLQSHSMDPLSHLQWIFCRSDVSDMEVQNKQGKFHLG